MRSVSVRVYDSGGRPVQGARVIIWVYQFGANGAIPEKYTDSDGKTEFDIDADEYADISVGVNGVEKVGRSAIKGSYRIEI